MPAATKKVTRKPVRKAVSLEAIRATFTDWLQTKKQADEIAKKQTDLRDELKAEVQVQGYTDDKGSFYLELDEPVVGPDGKTYGSLKNERRVTQSLNEDKAEKLLRRKNLMDECTELVLRVPDQAKAIKLLQDAGLLGPDSAFSVDQMLDEEAILRAHFEGKITQSEIDSIFESTETFAFKPQVA